MSVVLLVRCSARARQLRRRIGDVAALCGLVALAALFACVAVYWPDHSRPTTALAVPMLLGGLLLRTRDMRLLLAVTGGFLALSVVWLPRPPLSSAVVSLLILAVVAVVSNELATRRDRLGVRDTRADTMLLELQDRLRVQAEVPALPSGWRAETALRSAGGAGFAGDFLVSTVVESGQRQFFELALVDVSGKGVDAGTRALLLSGAMGGLLGSVPQGSFLSEANRYLVRQRWGCGFATAVHLRLDLGSGQFWIGSAGHPPAAHFDAGSGTWRLSRSSGPLLGLWPNVEFDVDGGWLRPGDALLFYTDGVVEGHDHELDIGIDRLLGRAERLIPRGGCDGVAAHLVDTVPGRGDDDRALVLVWRER